MPVPSFTLKPIVEAYDIASLPPSVWTTFREHERAANVMYSHAQTALKYDREALWLTCSSYGSGKGSSTRSIDLILSCGSGPLGTLPIFILATAAPNALTPHYLTPRLEALVDTLLEHVPVERVFSVFAPEPVTRIFSQLWQRYTRVSFYQEPYYAAKFATLTRETFNDRRMTLFSDVSYHPRLAIESDLEAVADLCKGFASTSVSVFCSNTRSDAYDAHIDHQEPFVLSEEGARLDAAYMIQRRCIWVLEARVAGKRPELSSIVASCRQSGDCATITKVYTNPLWRKRGCAERLVRWVCKQLLKSKSSIVLYVAHNNPAAAGVYHRVGFVGTGMGSEMEPVDPWMEIGFDRSIVELGHW